MLSALSELLWICIVYFVHGILSFDSPDDDDDAYIFLRKGNQTFWSYFLFR